MIKVKINKNKKMILLALFIVAFTLISAIFFTEKDDLVELVPKPVTVITVLESDAPVVVEYVGVVESAKQKKAGFTMSGILNQVFVKEGDIISAGQVLAYLDKDDLNRIYQASENTMKIAKEAYVFIADQYQKLQHLHEAGGLSAQELEKARIEMESKKISYENAKLDFENKAGLFDDAVIKSDFDGLISKVLFEVGEIVPAGQPVVIINSIQTIISTNLVQKDIPLINEDTETTISFSGQEYPASILSINRIPDPGTLTYPVELLMTGDDLQDSKPIGSLVTVNFKMGLKKAITIPLTIISNDGQDFVFVVDKDNRVHKKSITLGQVSNHEVMVYGLNNGDRVVSEGFRNIKQGEIVRIRNLGDNHESENT